MNRSKMASAVKCIAIGYLFLYLNFNLGTLNILPDWVCYVLIVGELPTLGEEEPSASLLRPLGILLGLWEALQWGLTIFGVSFEGYLMETIAAVVTLYFHFQLLTNLAHIAEKYECPERKRLLTLRACQAVFTTVMALPLPWESYTALGVGLIIIILCIVIWICYTLFSLEGSLLKKVPGSYYNP